VRRATRASGRVSSIQVDVEEVEFENVGLAPKIGILGAHGYVEPRDLGVVIDRVTGIGGSPNLESVKLTLTVFRPPTKVVMEA